MFLNFFLDLRKRGIPVTLREYLDVLEGLQQNLPQYSVDDFYAFCRTALVKREQHLDKFDAAFGEFFKGIEAPNPEEAWANIPEEWLRKQIELHLSEEEKRQIEAFGGLEQLMERFRQLMQEQQERHQGGNKWIGTGGRSPFGAFGYNPEGFRVGQNESRHRRAVKVWDKRQFKNLQDDVELNTRNFKMALRRLRIMSREGQAEELDIGQTVRKTSKNGGMLEVEMVPAKKNNVKVLLLLDVGGSMDDFVDLTSRLFSAARYEFKHLEHYYFHNCVYEKLWKDISRRHSEGIDTYDLLHTYNADYKLIFVGDASMSPYEIMMPQGSVEHYNEEPGIAWLERLKAQFPNMVWLNPTPPQWWGFTQSIQMLREFTGNRMFPLTLSGITQAIACLQDPKKTYDKTWQRV